MPSHPYSLREDRRTWAGGVRAIIPDGDGRILMIRQKVRGLDIWLPPGGYVDPGETSRAAAVREAKEETGLDVRVKRLLWHVEDVEGDDQFFVIYYLAEATGGELALGSDPEFDAEHQILNGIGFFSREELGALEHVYPHFLAEGLWEELERADAADCYREGSKMVEKGTQF
ncbi:MAG: NUDIX domain-containing protein [Clostridiales Family XIII bacterium]|jgi:ADP-ribose pyrophosphatase YjhB (NUDIX family)|nr:NUDIX domain-containing protein [Clostridiales Family XIII bacterium]